MEESDEETPYAQAIHLWNSTDARETTELRVQRHGQHPAGLVPLLVANSMPQVTGSTSPTDRYCSSNLQHHTTSFGLKDGALIWACSDELLHSSYSLECSWQLKYTKDLA